METLQEINLKPLWHAILEVYQEIAHICEKHKLCYYVTDGTAIGAVRHHGFIPWDDDFDMSMPREDYEKFILFAKTELPPHLKFVNWKNTKEFPLLFGQVHDCRPAKIAEIEKACGYSLSLGIYVDIFPIDGYVPSRIKCWFICKYAYILRAIWRAKGGIYAHQSTKGKILMFLGRLLAFFFPSLHTPSDVLALCEKLQVKYPFKRSSYSSRASVYLTGLNRPPLPTVWWGTPVWMNFENIQVPLPQNYDAYLQFYYGDYLTLPPPEKRRLSHKYTYRTAWCYGPTNI